MEEQIQDMAEAYKLLGDKTRLSIIALLQERELCVCEITGLTGMSQPNASQHLRKLKVAGLVNERRQGQWIYYSLNPGVPGYVQSLFPYLPSMKHKLDALQANCCQTQEEV